MLSKILNLTYNEILKQIKKKSVKIILGLILILAITFPVIIRPSNKTVEFDKYDIENLNTRLNNVNKQIDILKSDKTEWGKILKNNLEIEKSTIELSKEGKVGYYDWRKEEVDNYQKAYSKIFIIKEILNNTSPEVLLKKAQEDSYLDVEKYLELSKGELKKEINILEKELNESKEIVLKKDYIKYLNNNVLELTNTINKDKKDLVNLEKKLEKESNNDQLEKEINNIKTTILKNESILYINTYRLNNKINFEKDNWKNNALEDIKSKIEKLNEPMFTKDEFEENAPRLNLKMSYEEYSKEYKEKIKQLKDKVNIKWYSLKNNQPQLDDQIDARSVLNTASNQYIILTILTLIIIGGGIVSSEFSKGTIRLLLIRPVSRGKILLSKILALLVIGYGIIISSILISTISSGIIFGFKTLATPILKAVSGKIIEISFFKYLSQNVLLGSASFIFIIAFVFMLSTITKSTAISVALSMVLYLGSVPLTIILLTMNIKWIASTFIPYVAQAFFNLMPSFIEILKSQIGVKFNQYNGVIQLLLISIIFLLISFISFNKRDINN